MQSVKKVFGMTRRGIEPQSPGALANTLSIMLVYTAFWFGFMVYQLL